MFGPLRDSTMGFRIFIGVVVGVSFRILQDMLGPLSIVFEFPPLMAVLAPVLFCVVVGLYLLKAQRLASEKADIKRKRN